MHIHWGGNSRSVFAHLGTAIRSNISAIRLTVGSRPEPHFYGAFTVFLSKKLPNIPSCMVYGYTACMYASGHPSTVAVSFGRGCLKHWALGNGGGRACTLCPNSWWCLISPMSCKHREDLGQGPKPTCSIVGLARTVYIRIHPHLHTHTRTHRQHTHIHVSSHCVSVTHMTHSFAHMTKHSPTPTPTHAHTQTHTDTH